MTIEEAKDQASQMNGYGDFQQALADCYVGNGNMLKLQEIVNDAIEVYGKANAKDESSKFAHWLANLPIREMVTVHPPAGSGGSHGIYELTFEQLYEKYQNSQS